MCRWFLSHPCCLRKLETPSINPIETSGKKKKKMRGRLQNQPLEAARDYGLGCVRNAELGPIRYAYSMLIFALLYVIFLKMGGRLTPHFSAFWVYKNSPPPKKKVKILRFIVTTYPATVVLALKAEHAITVKQTCT